MNIEEKCDECGKQIPWICFFGNLTLALFKVAVGLISGSQGLVADGLHSGSDVLATMMVIISLKVSEKPENKRHPWGYGKVEYIGSLFVYSILLCLGSFVFIEAARKIILGELKPPHMISLFAALVSIVGNLILSSYGYCAGKRLNSPAMMANANENKADMLSSIAVVIGIVSSRMGFAFGDPLAAIAVGILIIRMAVTLLIEALSGLMDKSIDKRALGYIKQVALAQKGVKGVSFLRARKCGGKAWIELEIVVDYRRKVTEANRICSEVRSSILRRAIHIKNVDISFVSDRYKKPVFDGAPGRNRILDILLKKRELGFSSLGKK